MKKSKINEYNAKGAPESSEAADEKDEFKKGGKIKHKKFKHGGHVKGKASHMRLDKPKRASGGRSPYSTAAKVKSEADDAGKFGEKETPELKQKVYKKGGHVKAQPFHNKASKHHGG